MQIVHVRTDNTKIPEDVLRRKFEAAIAGFNSGIVITDEDVSVDVINVGDRAIQLNGVYVVRVSYNVYRDFVCNPATELVPFHMLDPKNIHALDVFINAFYNSKNYHHAIDGYVAWKNVLIEHYNQQSMAYVPNENWIVDQFDELPVSARDFFTNMMLISRIVIG